MPAVARDHLEALLRHRKLDHTLTPGGLTPLPERGSDPIDRWLVPTGMAALDARLEGGLPRGQVSEVIGPRSSGRLAIIVSALAGATARGELVALIDPLDMFDPVSAAANVDFQRLLWIRGEPSGSARVSLSCEYGTLQKSLDRAVKALNIVLQAGPHAWQPRVGPEAGGFGLVVLDLGEVAAQAIQRLPYTTWLRLQRVIEGSATACVLIGTEPIARSSGGVTVLLAPGCRPQAPGRVGPAAGSLQSVDVSISARVIRARKVESDQYVRVPLSAAAC